MVEDDLKAIRSAVYGPKGYHIVSNFIDKQHLETIKSTWTSDIRYHFDDFKRNKEVGPGTSAYAYFRPTTEDFAYCTHIWNDPLDELLHTYAYRAQFIRNHIEGCALYSGLHEASGKALQYRVCRTVSAGQVVNKHADFFSEYRSDPTGDHTFDPSRVQITLMLSDYDKDYTNGGFKLWVMDDEPILFGHDVEARAGDLIVWRYSIPHEVGNVVALDKEIGFLRVIFPQFDTNGYSDENTK